MIKNNRGITVISLSIAVIILLIVTGMLVYSAKDSVYVKNLTNMQNDISNLRDKISLYYSQYGALPASTPYTNTSMVSKFPLGANDDLNGFLIIDLKALDGLTLNYGKDYEKYKDNNSIDQSELMDIYVINQKSHNIFYVQGVGVKENGTTKIYYTDYTEGDKEEVEIEQVAGIEKTEIPEGWTSKQVTPITDGEGGVIPLPDGFYYVGGKKSEGIVISDNPADEGRGTSHEIAQTLKGNQFVWVPVEVDKDFVTYKGYGNGELQSWLGTEPYLGGYATEQAEYSAMKDSVLQYDGFYVGRYEAGVDGEERTQNSGIDDEVVIKQGKNVYNYIGWSSSNTMTVETGGAVEKAKNLATSKGYTSVTSTLIYGAQWDAIMSWIDSAYKTGSCAEDSFVVNSTGKGYYEQSSPTITGSNADYAVKNIYDLAGNVWEWTMESSGSDYRVMRGR